MKAKILVVFLSVIVASCYYDNEEELYNCSIDPATIRYSTTVTNIFTSYGCLGCHGNVAPSDGINLSIHSGSKAVAGDGRLYGAITHASGYPPMPQGGGKINACDIRKIKAWIDAGAPNN
ncbi:MAG: hypothetical protein EOO06_21305 [Chitinophagaceae bacterium]|nr:MAG: hypothetical protein EOO06_21305 [Chitinophagaceae bacterium]